MNVKSAEKKENSTVELVIEVPAEEFEAAVERAYRKNKGKIAIPGFRKGHAPRKIIESMYGPSMFYEDAVDEVYPKAYSDAVEQENLDVVAYPAMEILSVGKEGLTFKATVTVKPEVKLGEYKGLTAPKDAVEITDEDVEKELAPLVERATRLVSVEREARMGDTAVIDFEGFDNGVPFQGGKGENHSLELGSHAFVPGFEEGVVGMKPDEEKELNVTFPEDYAPDLAGKAVVFKVKLHELKEKVLPTVDDEFAKDVSEFETLDELKKDLADKLRSRRQETADRAYENALMEQVCDNMQVELPDPMVDYKVDEMMDDFARRIGSQGIPFEQYMQYMGTDLNTMKTQMRPNAIANLKSGLALEAIADAENLEVAAEELEAEYSKLAAQYGVPVDQVKGAISEKDLTRDVCLQKAAKVVTENGKVGEAPAKKEPEEKPEDAAEKKPAAKRKTAKKAETGEAEAEKKPAAKGKTAKKAETAEAEAEKKPAAKKSTGKKAAAKTEE